MMGPSLRLLVAGVTAMSCLAVAGCSDPAADLGSGSTAETIEALRACAETRDPEVVKRVAQVVSHQDTMVAAEAVRSLGRMRHEKAVAVIQDIAAGTLDRRSAVRQEAVIQLGRQRQASEEVLGTLREVVTVDPDPRVRAAAATSIAQQRSLMDVALLIDVAEQETDPVVQARAVGAVEKMVGLRFGYDPTASKDEREAALQRLRRLGTTAAAAAKRFQEHKRGR